MYLAARNHVHRATGEQPDQAKGQPKDDEAVTAVVKLPDELEVSWAARIGQEGPGGPSQQPPDSDRRRDGEAEEIRQDAPKRRPTETGRNPCLPPQADRPRRRPESVCQHIHRAWTSQSTAGFCFGVATLAAHRFAARAPAPDSPGCASLTRSCAPRRSLTVGRTEKGLTTRILAFQVDRYAWRREIDAAVREALQASRLPGCQRQVRHSQIGDDRSRNGNESRAVQPRRRSVHAGAAARPGPPVRAARPPFPERRDQATSTCWLSPTTFGTPRPLRPSRALKQLSRGRCIRRS